MVGRFDCAPSRRPRVPGKCVAQGPEGQDGVGHEGFLQNEDGDLGLNLVLFETSGNQRFIFATNKLRENVGASQLTYWAGTRTVLDAVKKAGGPALWDANPTTLRSRLADRGLNTPIESSDSKVEVILATSGKALLLVDREETGRKIVQDVTEAALRFAPGLDIRGVVGNHPIDSGNLSIHEAVRQVHRLLEKLGAQLPSPEARFARLPIIDECATSGLPANFLDKSASGERQEPRSVVSWSKRDAASDGLRRMTQIVQEATRQEEQQFRLYENIDELERKVEALDWLAVIHADGNGLGRIFLDFKRFSAARTAREYVDRLRDFSIALEMCTERAFVAALRRSDTRLQNSKSKKKARGASTTRYLPVVPLVLGGDDLTVICDGRQALDLTHDYLVYFEKECANPDGPMSGIVPRIAAAASGGVGRLSSCAGVSIVKPHYPFHAAYELAEDLIGSAKKVKDRVQHRAQSLDSFPCSALDFLIHHDSSGSDLDAIRDRLIVDREEKTSELEGPTSPPSTYLFTRPFVVTDLPEIEANQPEPTGLDWAKSHHWSLLARRVGAIQAEGEEHHRKLPSSMLHELRDGLFHGQQAADARLQLVVGRYLEKGMDQLTVVNNGKRSLFETEGGRWITRFLDALDASEFLTPDK